MAKKSIGTGVGVGGSSILVIFILLCLTTFATLSMVSANADLRLTEKTVSAVEEFYAADGRAEEILAKLDGIVAANAGLGSEAFLTSCVREIQEDIPEVISVEPASQMGLRVQYQVPASEGNVLRATVEILASGGDRVQRLEWLTVPSGDWQPESDGFFLWDGEEGEEEVELAASPF